MSVVRVAGAAFAVLMCAWFALGIRQAHDTDRAAAIASQSTVISAAQAPTASSLLHDAGLLNPDQHVNVLRAQVALERGDAARSRQIVEDVTRAEPQNLEAWLWLAHASGSDRALFYRALRRVRLLEPSVPRSR
jgi:predicted Zn-dependent protease